MFVVFEGIDGSGKTTVSNLVAQALRERGIAIEHVREGGEFASPLVARMREFGKDTRNLSLRPLAEFLMYVARDAQLLEECIAPALSRGGLVFADRYLYSYEVLGHYGRGLEVEQVRPIIDAVAGGVWPDLVVLMDVDPHLAKARRKVAKLEKRAKGGPKSGGSRKSLGGAGMMHRLREGYLQLANREPNRWLVIDNSHADLDMVVERVTEAIASLYEGAPTSKVVAGTNISRRATTSADAPTVEAAREAFYERIALRREKEPPVAAYFLSGLADEQAHEWRVELCEEAPTIVAYGLRGLYDEGSWELRDQLKDRCGHFIAKSLSGPGFDEVRAQALRKELVATFPLSVLSTLGGVADEFAWKTRERLYSTNPLEVMSSLKLLDSVRAWELRDRFWKERENEGGDDAMQSAVIASLSGIRGLTCEKSWEYREKSFEAAPVDVLRSLDGLTCMRSWRMREEFAELAPKVVLRTFDGQDSEQAWAMRKRFASKAKEALDSMRGLDGPVAWGIREALSDVWPSTVLKSLGDLATSERASAIVEYLLGRYPNNMSLLKHATQIAATSAAGPAARKRAVDAV